MTKEQSRNCKKSNRVTLKKDYIDLADQKTRECERLKQEVKYLRSNFIPKNLVDAQMEELLELNQKYINKVIEANQKNRRILIIVSIGCLIAGIVIGKFI